MRFKSGFTILELLTVMAIIAILSALIFPAFNRARDNANQSSDIADMNQIRTALQLYYVDKETYPPALFGYVTQYDKTGRLTEVIPADKVHQFLYPRREPSLETFRPVLNKIKDPLKVLTAARYPNKDPNTDALLDLNGDGKPDYDAKATQAFGPEDGFVSAPGNEGMASLPKNENDLNAAKFYKVSGYDVAEVPIKDPLTGKNRVELRYTLFWTRYALQEGGSKNDDPRQLGYSDPPEDTIVTWNSYFRDWEGSGQDKRPTDGKRDIVLFLGGSAKKFRSSAIFDRSWRVLPRHG